MNTVSFPPLVSLSVCLSLALSRNPLKERARKALGSGGERSRHASQLQAGPVPLRVQLRPHRTASALYVSHRRWVEAGRRWYSGGGSARVARGVEAGAIQPSIAREGIRLGREVRAI